ncbi:MAG: Activator of Hsp90 ATPase 1 family protein [Alphaproteobacteria bacterium]|nr:Activator of Hsp90 ATPase 1 family protein [Alphaproteobacteria bacterium]
MPPAADTLAPTGFEIDRATHTIRLTRDFAADPAQVFAAWTQPEQVACWWDAAGEPLARCEIDLRVGGAFAFVSRGHPDMPFAGIYREIAPPAWIVFDAMGAVGRVLLAEAEGGTHMIVEIECATAEQLEQFVKMGVHIGTGRTLDNLVAHLDGAGAA